MRPLIDVGFDVYSDTPRGKDPDSHSATLRRYHARLWSKPLPGGGSLALLCAKPKGYLVHRFEDGSDLPLSSDSIGHTYRATRAMAPIIAQVPPGEMDDFFALCSTVGAYMLFPARKVDGKTTINGARGFNARIKDRFDLTLECIRRHYVGEDSPLGETLTRYADFFALFQSFRGYVDFFLLQDLLEDDRDRLRFFMRFDGFQSPALPQSLADYCQYRNAVSGFIRARNVRIAAWDRDD